MSHQLSHNFTGAAFDMDGVILDSEKIYRINEYKAAETFGFPTEKVEGFCNLIAGGTRDGNARHFHEVFQTDMNYDDYRAVVSEGVDRYAEEHGYDLKPGVRELLTFLREHHIRTVLATSTDRDRALRFLEPHHILPFFDQLVFGNMVSRGKPAPDIYLTACRVIDTPPAETVGIEDSINGVLSSHAAGLYTVMVEDLIPPNETARQAADRILGKNQILKVSELFTS